jgi:hypothetical protein
MLFKPGKSGNPQGRPKGARNKTTVATEQLLDGEAEAITKKAIELAKSGDQQNRRWSSPRALGSSYRRVAPRVPAREPGYLATFYGHLWL